jgi:hypothetical protein
MSVFSGDQSIGKPKKGLFQEGASIGELGAAEGEVGKSVQVIAQNFGTLSEMLDGIMQVLKATDEVAKQARDRQGSIAQSVGDHAVRLAAIAKGTDNRELQSAARDVNAQVDPVTGYVKQLDRVADFGATALAAIGGLIKDLHEEPASMAVVSALPDQMATSSAILCKAAAAADSHAPTL